MSCTSLNHTATATAIMAVAARVSQLSDLPDGFVITVQDVHLENMLLKERGHALERVADRDVRRH